jgi:hypothetical protein
MLAVEVDKALRSKCIEVREVGAGHAFYFVGREACAGVERNVSRCRKSVDNIFRMIHRVLRCSGRVAPTSLLQFRTSRLMNSDP